MATDNVDNLFRNRRRQYKDFDTSLSKNPITHDVLAVSNENAVKQSVRNLISTRFGERLMAPEIGSGVFDALFEPLDPFSAETLRNDILNTIKNYEPRVVVQDCIVSSESSYSDEINIELIYIIVGENLEVNSQIILQRPGS